MAKGVHLAYWWACRSFGFTSAVGVIADVAGLAAGLDRVAKWTLLGHREVILPSRSELPPTVLAHEQINRRATRCREGRLSLYQ
jgi:hypothetical protein